MTDRKIIWTREEGPDQSAKYYEGWFGAYQLFLVIEYSHASYPFFINWRMGAYKDTPKAMAAIQWYLNNPEKLPDF